MWSFHDKAFVSSASWSLTTYTHWHPDQPTAPTCVPDAMSQFSSDYPWATRPKCEPLRSPAPSTQPATVTPRTEAAVAKFNRDNCNGGDYDPPAGRYVCAHFARTLERELAERFYRLVAEEQKVAALESQLTAQREAHDAALSTIRGMEMEDEKLRGKLTAAEQRILADNKAYGCELRDPSGTIWEHAAGLEKKLALADELAGALDTLRAVVGLTAFRHEGQRAPLQEAMDLSGSALTRYRAASAPTTVTKGEGV
jgi:hypothetical protein